MWKNTTTPQYELIYHSYSLSTHQMSQRSSCVEYSLQNMRDMRYSLQYLLTFFICEHQNIHNSLWSKPIFLPLSLSPSHVTKNLHVLLYVLQNTRNRGRSSQYTFLLFDHVMYALHNMKQTVLPSFTDKLIKYSESPLSISLAKKKWSS